MSVIFTCLLLICLHSLLISGIEIQNVNRVDRIQNQYLITLNTEKWDLNDNTLVQQKIKDIVKTIADTVKDLKVVRKYVFLRTIILSVRFTFEASVANLVTLPEIENIEANVVVKSSSVCAKQSSVPWALSRIARRDKSGSQTYEYFQNDGEDIYAYVIDTGIYTGHHDFGGRAEHGYTAYNIFEGDDDYNGHGTHCTGSIMSKTYGIAKSARAIAIKVLDELGTGNIDGIIDGIKWVFNHYNGQNTTVRAVASMSLGAGRSGALDAATQELIDIGLPVVVAAGNSKANASFYSPAAVEDAITVAASDPDDQLAWYSNWGLYVDIIAPGTDVLSTHIGNPSSTKIMSGTSMAAPHVAGTILQHLSQVQKIPSPKEIKDWLLSAASQNRINVEQTQTPNKLLYAPCNLTHIASDPGTSRNTIAMSHGNWCLVIFNIVLVYSVILLQ